MPKQPRFLIIDPEEAFHPGGPLAVKGANEDSERIIEMLTANIDAKVYVSLDSHTIKHIGHYGFWKRVGVNDHEDPMTDLQGNPIEYYYEKKPGYLSSKKKESLFIQPPDGDKVYIEARNPVLKEYAINYVKELYEKDKVDNLGKAPMLWPTHCVIGDKSKGRAIYPPLFEALKDRTNVKYYKKGENDLAEMYSIFKSELQPENIENGLTAYFEGEPATSGNLTGNVKSTEIKKIQDEGEEEGGAYLNTGFNAGPGSLYSELINGATSENPVDIYICGEALSHCVNYSLRHLVEKLMAAESPHVNVYLVLNCSSTVVLEGIETFFFGNSSQLINDILEKYNAYCDIVFWNGSALISSDYIVEKTKGIFDSMKGTYVESEYQAYLESKHGLIVDSDAAKGVEVEALNEAFNVKVAAEAPLAKGAKEAKGGKRTKKKRRSKTQKKRKGQIKKSKRHRRSRK